MDALTDHLKALQIELLTTIKGMEALDASTAAAAHYSALCVCQRFLQTPTAI